MPYDSAPDTPEPSDAPQPEPRAVRRMRRLEQVADMGVDIARLLNEQAAFAAACAKMAPRPQDLPGAPELEACARAFAQVSRAISLATALEDRIDRGLPALPDLDHARRRRQDAADAKRLRARDAVERALLDDPALGPRRRACLSVDLNRLLDREMADLDRFLDRPFPEIVARLNRALGLEPVEDQAELWGNDDGADISPPPQQSCGGGGPRRGGGGTRRNAAGSSPKSTPADARTRNPKPAPASPLHRHSAVPLPHACSAGEEREIRAPP